MLKQPIEVPDRPYHLSWDLTSECHLHCSFCYNPFGENNPAESRQLTDLIIDQTEELSPLHLGIGGGDPVESRYLTHVLKRLFRDMGDRMPEVTIDTMQLSRHPDLVVAARRFNEVLLDNRVGFYLSVHGIGKIHDQVVGKSGHFVEQIRAVQFLREAGVPFAMGLVPTIENLDQLDQVLELAKGLGAGLLNISQFVEVGRGEGQHSLNLSSKQYNYLLEWIEAANRRMGKRYVVTHEHWLAGVDQEMLESEMFVGCSAGIYYMGVRSNGDIVPCQLNTHVLGNVRNKSLLDVWKNSPDLARWRMRDVSDPCGSCLLLAKCGGCRCNAVAAGNGFFGADPLCPVKDKLTQPSIIRGTTDNIIEEGKKIEESGDIAIIRLHLKLATRKGTAIIVQSDERNSFLKLTGCAKAIYEELYKNEEIYEPSLTNSLKANFKVNEIHNELCQLERLGVVTCDRE